VWGLPQARIESVSPGYSEENGQGMHAVTVTVIIIIMMIMIMIKTQLAARQAVCNHYLVV
jgi:hypothetical protein